MRDPLVSVVTPVFNGAEFLEDCLESVLGQTYKHFTLRVIDNSSTDETPEIVERLARKDSRVLHERHEDFVDATENHNRAFRSIESDCAYVKVVQADDLLLPECLERMVRLALERPAVGVVSGYRLRDSAVELIGLPFPESFAPGRSILRQSLLGGPFVTGSPTSLLLRADLVRRRDPFYDHGFAHCDTDAAYWALTQSDFALVHGVMTYSRRQAQSRISRLTRLKSFAPENIRLLLKYGPEVLTPAELRERLRYELTRYVWFHMKQRVKPSRWRDRDFHRFHNRMTRLMEIESHRDREVVMAATIVRTLLSAEKPDSREDRAA